MEKIMPVRFSAYFDSVLALRRAARQLAAQIDRAAAPKEN
jgi:hypothetical protein